MATMSPPSNLNSHSASPFSPSQLKKDLEAPESKLSLNGTFDEKELLTHRLESASTINADLAAQLEFLKKKYQGLQEELTSTLHSQTNLEKQYYTIESDLEKAKQKEDETSRRARDIEFKLKKEAKEFEDEKARFSEREESLRAQIKTLHAQQQQQKGQASPTAGRASRTRSVSVSFSPPAYLPSSEVLSDDGMGETGEATLMHEAKLANRTVRQQLKEIGTLKATISQLNEQLASQTAQSAVAAKQFKQMESEVERLTLANSSLAEEIESYQLLLEDRTLRGQFTLGHHASSFSLTAEPSPNGGGFNLGSELSQAQSPVDEDDSVSVVAKDELRQLKDENKALALYISKILGKIMSNPVLAEAITHNGDSSGEQDQAKSEEEDVPTPLRQLEVPSSPTEESKDKGSRFGGFLSPTFGMGGFSSPVPAPEPEITSRVSFDLPSSTPRPNVAPSRKSTDSICNDLTSPDRAGSGSQSPFRSRRSKSMSVPSRPDEKEPSGGVFSFRTALKRMAGPWKSASKPIPEVATATAMSAWEESTNEDAPRK